MLRRKLRNVLVGPRCVCVCDSTHLEADLVSASKPRPSVLFHRVRDEVAHHRTLQPEGGRRGAWTGEDTIRR